MKKNLARFVLATLVVVLLAAVAFARPAKSSKKSSAKDSVTESPRARRKLTRGRHHRRHRYYERFYTSSYATDTTDGDLSRGEDATVRAAALDALGNFNGTVVAIDPDSGRILAMVNQKLALSEGAMPCSTIKLAVALAALNENLVTKETDVAISRRRDMDLTEALAHSNNAYFEALGRQLGFTKVSSYAHLYGLGELAGYNIAGEHLGAFPMKEVSRSQGGVGRMCSYGEGISMTPLQLGALVSAIANGGTLYYLQHPTSPADVANFQPRIKRHLEIAPAVQEMMDGLAGAVEYGTARSVRYNFSEEQILGKTGTCSKDGTRYGWFVSYANTQYGRIVTVVFLRGGRPTFGPKAAEIAGRMYRNLYDNNFFAVTPTKVTTDKATTAVGAPQ